MGACYSTKPGGAVSAVPSSAAFHAAELNKVIQRSPELRATAINYLESILPGFNSILADLNPCLETARYLFDLLSAALFTFEKEKTKKRKNKGTKKKKAYAETVAKLLEFKQAAAGFAGLSGHELQPMLENLREMMEELHRRKKEVKARLRWTKRWRKAWDVAFTAAFVGVLVCSVMLAVAGAPSVAITAATVSSTAMKAVEPWVNSYWGRKEKALTEEKQVVQVMRDGGVAVHELDSIRSLVENLKKDYEALKRDVDFVLEKKGEEEAAAAIEVGMMEIKRRIEIGGGRSSIEYLKKKVDECTRAKDEFIKTIRN